jgi:multisubunit Na+/H+ antiporter MnhB subunit
MYLLYQAPDLALTQLMFEIISVVLFMLVFRLLPEASGQRERREWWRVSIAGVAGIAVGWTVLHAGAFADDANQRVFEERMAMSSPGPEGAAPRVVPVASGGHGHTDSSHAEAFEPTGRLGDWFLRYSYDGGPATGGRGGGGNNVVNVILVDFRGYDTLGEITVLSIAMIGVLALIGAVPAVSPRYSGTPGATFPRRQPIGPQPHLRSVLFRTGMRLVLPLALIFAAYVFFKGHQEPGGGFIAGLIASVGLAVYRMAEGKRALTRLVPFRPGKIAAVGLAIALVTGVVPLIMSLLPGGGEAAFLTSAQAYIPRPGADPYHLASVAFFDLGVFIVVVGVSVGMINRFEEELE